MKLVSHPASRPKAIERMEAVVLRDAEGLHVEFCMWGDLHNLKIPPARSPARRDRLWETTCFEVFLRPSRGPTYFEINLSPSGEWASYQFDEYRKGMRQSPIAAADGAPFYLDDGEIFEMDQAVLFNGTPELQGAEPWQLGLSAIVEEGDGRKSYWALAHPDGPPDFHHPDCFVAKLP